MGIDKWNPLGDLITLQDRMNSLLKNALNEASLANDRRGLTWSPQVDFYETDDSFLIVAELPGLESKDIDLKIEENTLVLSGGRQDFSKNKKKNYFRREISKGTFQRTFSLPSPVRPNSVKALFQYGVLEVELPKSTSKEGKSFKIDIQSS